MTVQFLCVSAQNTVQLWSLRSNKHADLSETKKKKTEPWGSNFFSNVIPLEPKVLPLPVSCELVKLFVSNHMWARQVMAVIRHSRAKPEHPHRPGPPPHPSSDALPQQGLVVNTSEAPWGKRPFCSVKPGCPIGWCAVCYLFFKLRQLARQLSHETDSGVQSLLQRSDLVLFALSLWAHQRHGPHPGKPVQILLLKGRERCYFLSTFSIMNIWLFCNKLLAFYIFTPNLKIWVSKIFF